MWKVIKATVFSFIEDEALSRGAAIAFYTVTSLAPVLLIVVAIAGFAFGQEAAQDAITTQLTGLMGPQTADVLQSAIAGAADRSSGILATAIGLVTLLVTASGVFGEMQTALNKIWDAEPRTSNVSRLIWARATSLGLVAALGFLLLVSLVVSAVLTAFGNYLNSILPFGEFILSSLNFIVSLALISALFAAIYKVLPDRAIAWRDVVTGAIVTALLFTLGKSLIGWYLGSSAVGSSYGAAGGLIILLLWVYYSAQLFLLGAEFTKAYATFRRGESPAAHSEKDSLEHMAASGTKGAGASSSGHNGVVTSQAGEHKMLATNEDGSSLRNLERDAERNRAALIDTVDALQQRLSPSAIKRDVQDYVQHRKDSLLHSLEQKARENPLPTAALAAAAAYPLWSLVTRIPVPLLLVGAGLALTRVSGSGGDSEASSGRGLLDEARERLGDATDAVKENLSELSTAVQRQAQERIASARHAADRLSDLKTQASESAENLGSRASEKYSETAEALRGVTGDVASAARNMMSTDRLQDAGGKVWSWADDTLSRNPLAVGALGLAIGAVIAAALPATRREDELLGPAADDLKGKAQGIAVAGVETAKDLAKDIYNDAAQAAQEQGLSVEHLTEAAEQIAGKLKTVAANALESQNPDGDDASSSTFSPTSEGTTT